MRANIHESEALSVSALARRWGIGPERVRALVRSGRLPGVLRIPSAGKFRDTIKIPVAAVRQAEEQWLIAPAERRRHANRRRRHAQSPSETLKHFPELTTSPEPGAECPAGGQH